MCPPRLSLRRTINTLTRSFIQFWSRVVMLTFKIMFNKTNLVFLFTILILFLLNRNTDFGHKSSDTLRFHKSSKLNEREIKISGSKILKFESILKNYQNLDFSLRGPIHFRAQEIEKELQNGVIKPFKKLTRVNLADSQATGQKPITFLRQVLAIVTYPELINLPDAFPIDAVTKAKRILQDCDSGTIGSYGSPIGLDIIRQHVTEYMSQRDGGVPTNLDDVFLTDGVTGGFLTIMKLFKTECNDEPPGLMVPIPLYPLYPSVMTKDGIKPINYFLNEENDWELEVSELERAYAEGFYKCNCIPKAILIINPGNPSGKVLSRKTMESVVRFAYSKNLVILADEVFQDNVYGTDVKFVSFKKVVTEMGEPYKSMELVSFNSVSKGYISESGLRGGYFEFINSDPKLKAVLFQLVSLECTNLIGQIALDCLVAPPKDGEPSFRLFQQEKNSILKNFEEVSEKLAEELNKLKGVNCSRIYGGVVAFPKISLPLKAIQAAELSSQKPDEFYGLELLEMTGISVAVGSAFGLHGKQTYLRITIPSSMEKLQELLIGLKEFHAQFMNKYS